MPDKQTSIIWQSLKRIYRIYRHAPIIFKRFEFLMLNRTPEGSESIEQSIRSDRAEKLINYINTGKGFTNV